MGRTSATGAGATLTLAALLGGLLLHPLAQGQTHQHGTPPPSATPAAPPGAGAAGKPRTISSDDLHRHGGVPPGWTFTLPAGDAAKGRQLFAALECFKCHTVNGEGFPEATDAKNVGPELSGMGGHHPAEYFAESILAPNAVILDGPGFTGPDGLSIMPSYADALSVTQWLDLVAYLKSLSAPDAGGHAHAGATGVEREQVAGDYRIRLTYHAAGAPSSAEHADHGAGGHDHHGAGASQPPKGQGHAGHDAHAGHHAGAGSQPAGAQSGGHLMAFVVDNATGQPVPYLPVTATLLATGAPARTLRLLPMMGGQGFHYGADVRLPAKTQKIRVSVGRTTMQVMGPAKDRFRKAVTAEFDWPATPQ
jgi:hypothetical protein